MTTVTDIYGSSESKYLKAADLKKKSVRVVIGGWEVVEFDEKSRTGEAYKARKIILSFQGKEKGLVVNKTNATSIEYAFGPEPDEWVGKEIELYPTMVSFGDDTVEAIRVRPTIEQATEDEIPF
jgi:hypothetical protein